MLCDNENGWDGGLGGRLKKEGIYVYKELTHIDVQQKLTSHCKLSSHLKKKKREISAQVVDKD